MKTRFQGYLRPFFGLNLDVVGDIVRLGAGDDSTETAQVG